MKVERFGIPKMAVIYNGKTICQQKLSNIILANQTVIT